MEFGGFWKGYIFQSWLVLTVMMANNDDDSDDDRDGMQYDSDDDGDTYSDS